ncbi:MAG TPA: DNA-formamidopyrimidine glycosylase family protein, partial [Gemmatimonadales bacterium]|nr:DNA-formamidopyrimidine glycosylase family protein [Gemmatimonadales bacterium]
MPELPDIALYLHALRPRVVGAPLERLRIASPFLLRTADPPVADLSGRTIRDVRRLGKRIVLAFADEYFVVLHLMIAGRLHWKPAGAPIPRRAGLA